MKQECTMPKSSARRISSISSRNFVGEEKFSTRRRSCDSAVENEHKPLKETGKDFFSKGKYEVSDVNFKAIETGKDSFSKGKSEVSDISAQDKARELNDKPNSLDELGNIVPSKQSANTKRSLYPKKFQEGDEERIRRVALGYVYMKNIYDNGDTYEGEWRDGNRDGKGRYVSVSGWYYEGGWKENKKHGQGKYVRKDGNVYEGEWLDGKRNGEGKYTCANDYVYQGQWKDDKRNGPGKIVREDGSSYEGGWKDDKMHGQGKYIFDDMECFYEGQYKNGKKHGVGKYANENGIVYEGEYKNGKKDGQGIHTSPNGSIYEGKYLEGKKHGKGIIYKNGYFYKVKFERGKQVYEKKWEEYKEYRQTHCLSDSLSDSNVETISTKQNLAGGANKKICRTINLCAKKSVKRIIQRPAKIMSFMKKKNRGVLDDVMRLQRNFC